MRTFYKTLSLVYVIFALVMGQSIPDYSYRQTYLGDWPRGMNVIYARKYLGGTGVGIKIVDIENSWNLNHVDLVGNVSASFNSSSSNHGTSVMGILVAKDNGIGITGFAPDAFVHGIKREENNDDISNSINQAVQYLEQNGKKGDIILIEVPVGFIGPDNKTYPNMPAELDNQTGNADAIKNAVDAGYVVVEVAANGNTSLNQFYGYPNIMTINTTGAIMVGAKDSLNDIIAGNSNFGERIDANGWGEFITTTGGGDLWGSNSNPNEKYTGTFGGTSGATPMVTGVVAILQSINEHYKGFRLTPDIIRSMIRGENNGLALGHRPNLKKLINKLELPTTVVFEQLLPDQRLLNASFSRLENNQWNSTYSGRETMDRYYADESIYRANQGKI